MTTTLKAKRRVSYDCSKCPAYCCSIYERVEVKRRDLLRLARHFGVTADVAARRYTGLGDFADWPANVPIERYAGFWDPNRPAPEGTPPGAYDGWPRYPGLYDRGQQPFAA